MSFALSDFAMFDIHILKRAEAIKEYPPQIIDAAAQRYRDMDAKQCETLTKTIVAGLPGAAEHFTLAELRAALKRYENIDADQLRQNLKAFLEAVVPTAERFGVKLCCHPDDPPWPVLGLPRVVSTEQDIEWLLAAVDRDANGLTFCSGSLGARADNDLPALIRRFARRIHFVHLRNVRRACETVPTSFFEDSHLAGSTDMIAVLRAFLEEHPTYSDLPMRPDHGQDILTDLGRNAAPGYPLCGRMRGLAELRGAMLALQHAYPARS